MSIADRRMTDADVRQLIAEHAYAIWETQGRPQGHDLIHWQQAELEIRACLEANAAAHSDSGPHTARSLPLETPVRSR